MESLRPIVVDGAAVHCNQADTEVLGMVFLERAGGLDRMAGACADQKTRLSSLISNIETFAWRMSKRGRGQQQ